MKETTIVDKGALWDRYSTAAPRPLTPSERQYSDRRLRSNHRLGVQAVAFEKWKKRDFVHDAPMGPKAPRSTVLSPEEEALIVAFRKHTLLPLDDCLYALQATIPHLTRSSLHRLFQRHDISRLPSVEGDRPRKKFKTYSIGYFHIDIAELRTEEGKLYMFVAIDRVSKFAFAELHEKATRRIAAEFLRHLIDAVPYKIHTVLTDNGTHFTTPGAKGSGAPDIKAAIERRIPRSRLRTDLRPQRHRASPDQAQPPLDERPGRENEPHAQGSHRAPILLRQPRSTTGPPENLPRRL